MKKNDLIERLRKEKISNSIYSLEGGLPNEKVCLDFVGNKWIVYYSERGLRTGIAEFRDESDACTYLYNQIKGIHTDDVR